MNWQIFILISLIFGSISTLLQKILLRDNDIDPIGFSIFFQVLIGIIFIVIALILGQNLFLNWNKQIFNIALAVVLYGFGNVFVFKALKNTEASKFTVLFSSRALFTTLASTLLLSEGLTTKQLVGAVLIILGIIVATLKSFKYKFQRVDLLGVAAGLFFGLANTNDRFLLHSLNLYPYLFMVFMLPGIFVLGVYPKTFSKMNVFLKGKIFIKILFLCSIYAISAVTFFAALQKAPNSSQVVNVNLVGVILTVILSIIFLKEKQNTLKKLVGALLAFIGLVLVG
jgi:transporter family protein